MNPCSVVLKACLCCMLGLFGVSYSAGEASCDDTDVLLNQGYNALGDLKTQEAIKAFDAAIRQDPTRPEAYAGRSLARTLLFSAGQKADLARATSDADAALLLGQNYFLANTAKGMCLQESDLPEQAVPYFTRAIELKQEHDIARYGRARAYYDLANSPRSVPQDRVNYADLCMDDLNRALEINPKCFMARLLRAECYRERGDLDNAIVDYDIVRKMGLGVGEISENEALLLIERAETNARMNHEPNVILADLNRAISILPNDPRPMYSRGSYLASKSRSVSALRDVNMALDLCGEQPPPRYYETRGHALFQLGRIREAVSDYEAARDAGCSAHAIVFNLGLGYSMLGQHASAAQCFTEAIQQAPTDARCYFFRALAHEALAQNDAAARDREAGMQLLRQKTTDSTGG